MTERRHRILDSPIGPLTLVGGERGLCGLYLDQQRHRPPQAMLGGRSTEGFEPVVEELAAYFAGECRRFSVALDLRGTVFQRRVWTALQAVPYGTTLTYSQLASRAGADGAARAIGSANGRNPVSIIVPCHRVVGADGGLVGYGGGLDRKRWLLDHERDSDPARV